MATDENSNPELVKLMFKAIGDNLDQSAKEEVSIFIDTSTSWMEGKETRKISETIFLMNSDAMESFKLFN